MRGPGNKRITNRLVGLPEKQSPQELCTALRFASGCTLLFRALFSREDRPTGLLYVMLDIG